jgi:hypothetical protein
MTLLQKITGLLQRDAPQLLYVRIPPDHVDVVYNTDPMAAGRYYFRLWLSEMYLKKNFKWFSTWYPAVHSLVHFQYDGKMVEVPMIAGSLNLQDVNEKNLDKALRLNYQMTTLMPFSGNVVEMTAGLLAMQGDNYLNQCIKVIGDFAGLLALPQLSTVMNVVTMVANEVDQLIDAGNGQLHLGLHDTFTGKGGGSGNELRAGYLAVILATAKQVKPDDLWVEDGRLRSGPDKKNTTAFTGYTYMLFRIENREERDDWDALSTIQEPFRKAIEALREGKKGTERAESFLRTAITAALVSPDLTKADRSRVATAMKEEYEEAQKLGLGAISEDNTRLSKVIQRAMPVSRAARRREVTFKDLFAM